MKEKITIFIGSRKFCALVVGLVFLLIVPLVIDFINIAASDEDGHAKTEKLVRDQDNIALILIGIGSFLGGRRLILQWLDDLVNPDTQLTDSSIKECEMTGFLLIIIGSSMEILDQLILHVEGLLDIGLILELTLNFPLDLLSSFLLLRLFFHLSTNKENKTA